VQIIGEKLLGLISRYRVEVAAKAAASVNRNVFPNDHTQRGILIAPPTVGK
jgi:hypothetical protein